MKLSENFLKELTINVETHLQLESLFPDIEKAIKIIHKKIKLGGKLMLCGNGGSAADAQHLSAEYIVRLRPNVNRKPIPAISLAQDTSTLTACLNDFGPDNIFKRVLSGLSQDGDTLLAISTSGNSTNIIEALKYAKSKGIYSLGFLGGDGGDAINYCSKAFVVPSNVTARIQESHITAGHALLQYIEDTLLERGWLSKV